MSFRDNPAYEVACFTATQIPGIANRIYPPKLAGRLYPKGIPIYPEVQLAELIKKLGIGLVVFSYSDVSHEYVMHRASIALANGADFMLLGPCSTQLVAGKPVISVCAVRTGAGKSQTTRFILNYFRQRGYRVVVIRHPMPYGDLGREAVQRFERYEDFERHRCTLEEREEYEPLVRMGAVVYAGVDYAKIVARAEREANILVWDGGNNDLPFVKPDLHIVVADPHRAGHELAYHPGEANLRCADVIIINKVDSAPHGGVNTVLKNIKNANPRAVVVKAKSTIAVKGDIRGKQVLVVEDGPTLTHGGMLYGAGTLAAKRLGARIVDASRHAVGSIRQLYAQYPHLKSVLPAMGYSRRQIAELQQTINRAKCDVVIDATPTDLSKLLRVNKPVIEVNYELDDFEGKLAAVLKRFEARMRKR